MFTRPYTYRGPDVLTANGGIQATYKISEGNFINSGGEYAPTQPSMAGVLVDGAGRPMPVVASKTGGGSGANPLAQAANAGMQQQRLELAQRRLALEEARFNAASTASKAAQEAQTIANKANPRTLAQPRSYSTQSNPPPTSRSGSGNNKGKGSGNKRGTTGSGGNKREKSPEQRAREKGRYDREMDRQNRRTAATQDRRNNEEYAKSRGFNNVRAMQDHDNFESYLSKNSPNRKQNVANSGTDDATAINGTLDRSKPFKNPYTDGPDTFANADEYEKWARERSKNDKSIKQNTTDSEADNRGDNDVAGGRKLRFLPGIGFRWM